MATHRVRCARACAGADQRRRRAVDLDVALADGAVVVVLPRRGFDHVRTELPVQSVARAAPPRENHKQCRLAVRVERRKDHIADRVVGGLALALGAGRGYQAALEDRDDRRDRPCVAVE